jgi:hypothetical protein
MSNLTSIDGKKKAELPCPYCGNPKACRDFTCPRIAVVEHFGNDHWAIEFRDDFFEDETDPAA